MVSPRPPSPSAPWLLAGGFILRAAPARAQRPPVRPAVAAAPSVRDIRYALAFDSASARRRTVHVAMSFDAGGAAPVLLSIPAWTPGAYEMSYYARKVSAFSASSGGKPVSWDKTDYDTCRIRVGAPGPVEVRFDFLA